MDGCLKSNLRKWQKYLILGLILARLVQICPSPPPPTPGNLFFVGFIYTRCKILSEDMIVCNFKVNVWSKLEKMAKNLILGLIYVYWAQIRTTKFFFKNLASSVTRYHGQPSSCKIEKTNDQISRKVSDVLVNKRTKVIS